MPNRRTQTRAERDADIRLARAEANQRAVDLWMARVEAAEASGLSHTKAVARTVTEHPELHRQYLAAMNERAGRRAVAAALSN